jgi:hypothetical protein
MANPIWPSTLPWFQRDGYSEGDADNRVVSQMDTGPPKMRRKSTSAPRMMSGVLILTETQYATLQGFFRGDCFDGTLPFDRNDVHGVASTFWWAEPPAYSPMGIDWAVSVSLLQQAF